MKARILLASLLFINIISTAQIQDLAKLADGKLVYQQNLRDGDSKLFGYFFLYEKNIGIDSVTMEYVLLDKNLNKALNGTFNEPKLKSKFVRRYHDCSLLGNNLVIDKVYILKRFAGYTTFLLNTFQIINMDSNIVRRELKYSDGQFEPLVGDFNENLALIKKKEGKPSIDLFSGDSISGFLVKMVDSFGKDTLQSKLLFLDENYNHRWTYIYSPKNDNGNFNYYQVLYSQGNTLYLGMNNIRNGKYDTYQIVAIDLQTGNVKYVYELDNTELPYQRNFYLREFDGQLNILGSYTVRQSMNLGYDFTKSQGYYHIRLDSAGNELASRHLPWINYKAKLKLSPEGYDDENYKLMPRQYYMFKDGSFSILTERYKPEFKGVIIPFPIVGAIVQASTMKKKRTDDFILMNFDSEMNLVRLDTIATEMSINNVTDYHFSEYIHDREGIVIFYVNSFKANKKQQVVLGINTVLNGTITEEKIPLYSKKEFAIYPMPAKEGYVMLREVNEKEKLNQIRLEKLNYDAL